MAQPPAHPISWYSIDKRSFEEKLRKLIERGDDLSPAFHTIGRMFRQSRKSIWQLKSSGGYPDFKDGPNGPYARRKEYLIGQKYPLLFLTGDLKDSVIDAGHTDNINIVRPKWFAFGTRIPYAKYHNSEKAGKGIIPPRKFIFWGPEAPRTAKITRPVASFSGRALKVLANFIARDRANAVR